MLIFFLSFFIYAQTSLETAVDKNQVVAEKIATKLEEDKKLINESESKQRRILSHLFEINQRIKKVSKEKSNLEGEGRLLEVSIFSQKDQILELEQTLQNKSRDLINHIRLIQQAQGFGWLNLLSGSKGPAEADLNLYIFSKLTTREKRKIQSYFVQKAQLQKNQIQLQARHVRLTKVTENLAVRQKDFLGEQANRKIALSEIKSKKSRVLERLKNLRNTELVQKLEDTGLLDGLSQASFLESKGNLDGPAKGTLRQRFGIVQTPRANYYKNHKGIFIQTKLNQDIHVVAPGKVAFVGEVGGFGNTLIVDHGDHYYTVYSALSDIAVHEGQLVEKKESLGKTGLSKFYSDSGIYFEVRHFSEPQDPIEWIKKGSL